MQEQPTGLCECGCGSQTQLAQKTNTKFGHVKGQPVRFVAGHSRGVPPEQPGTRYGNLVVVSQAANEGARRSYLCTCDCGQTTVVLGKRLRSGHTRSCGCIARGAFGARNAERERTHGHTVHGHRSRTYRSWESMVRRCTKVTASDYPNYGGRGITVCVPWMAFEVFLFDMGERPDGRTLDRIDVNGNYEPGNCRWATAYEQRMNRRR